MSSDFIIRLIGTVVFCILGVIWGNHLGQLANISPSEFTLSTEVYSLSLGLLGALVGLILTPFITTRPARKIQNYLSKLSAKKLFAAFLGLIMGLIIAALLAFPISMLPSPFGDILPFIGVLIFAYFGVAVFTMRHSDLFGVISSIFGSVGHASEAPQTKTSPDNWAESRRILIDTSVIIDGRIADIARTGFLPGTIIIPRFVLNELQYIADSSDSLRRQRGRRGMEVLSILQKEPRIPVQINDINVEGVREVDDKLVILARQMRCPILTNDYNLNRVAELQGVIVLNVNELANAVKSVMLPGEIIRVHVIQEGKEDAQGVGYMDDGTMVVVENGRTYLEKEINVSVTKVLQTAAGRMIFARPDDDSHNNHHK